jgi:hypothetical protein
MNKTAIVICSYNMPERTDKLVEHIHKTVKRPYDLLVVDNGSDLVPPSQYTNVPIPENVQTTNGFLAGLEHADMLDNYFAYWTIITSAAFIEEDDRDPLDELLSVLENDPLAFAVQPSIMFETDEAWAKWLRPRKDRPRRIWGIDYISTLFRAEYLNQIGRFRKELTMMWGVPGECNWKARKNGWHIYVHDGYSMLKETNIGYTMDRMNMTAEDRSRLASEESDEILTPIYGENYRGKFGREYRQTAGEY